MFAGFDAGDAAVNGQSIHYRSGGHGPPLLLLHGFPQTHVMWHAVAARLARSYTVVASDLRGYGRSSKPQGTDAYSFRHMACDQVALMQALGHDRFHVIGHDRGGRVAHRMALDHKDTVRSLTVMDIVPTHLLLDDLSKDVAEAYYHWFFLAQPAPFPETLIGHDPDAYFESCLLGFGAAQLSDFEPAALDAYRAAWRDPDTIRGMCADYRAALHIDFNHDSQDHGRRVDVPSLVLFGAQGAMARAYTVADTWREKLSHMHPQAIPGGHFFIDQSPQETSMALERFLSGVP